MTITKVGGKPCLTPIAVEISERGWQITRLTPGVTLRSARGQLPPAPSRHFADPVAGFPTLHLPDLGAQQWLLATLCPSGPDPILILHGAAGSGKTTAARMLRSSSIR